MGAAEQDEMSFSVTEQRNAFTLHKLVLWNVMFLI